MQTCSKMKRSSKPNSEGIKPHKQNLQCTGDVSTALAEEALSLADQMLKVCAKPSPGT